MDTDTSQNLWNVPISHLRYGDTCTHILEPLHRCSLSSLVCTVANVAKEVGSAWMNSRYSWRRGCLNPRPPLPRSTGEGRRTTPPLTEHSRATERMGSGQSSWVLSRTKDIGQSTDPARSWARDVKSLLGSGSARRPWLFRNFGVWALRVDQCFILEAPGLSGCWV